MAGRVPDADNITISVDKVIIVIIILIVVVVL
jgi:hypothetical protein